MHPLLARGERLALYLVLWGLVGGLLAGLLAGEGGLSLGAAALLGFPLSVAYGFMCVSAWYVARSTPIATSGAARLLGTALGAAIISSTTWLLAGAGWASLVTRWRGGAMPFREIAPTLFGFGVLLYLLSVAVSYILVAFELARAAERRELQAQVLSREAELRSLRAQIDPHFLFNSLHSISALTTIDPAGARRMTILLGDFLRESLALGALERITLTRELTLAEKYLEVERVRLGDRLQVQLDAGNAGDCLLPPLVLQPIVENAVKHGVAHVLDGGIVSVRASCTPVTLAIVVENPVDDERPKKPGTGLGLSNVRSRLRAVYGADAAVRSGESAGRWRVEVTLPSTAAGERI
jgi:two-component system, LytTR family, sensor histidine kinase AlgZ